MHNDDQKQQELFRDHFAADVGYLIAHCGNLTESLNMVTSILGKSMAVGRVIAYCEANGDKRWLYSEFGTDAFDKCRAFGWSPSQSVLVAKTVLAAEPLLLNITDANLPENLRNDLDRLQGQTYLGVGFGPESANKGCLIFLQRDEIRKWTDNDIGFIQSIALELGKAIAQNFH